MNRIMPLLLSFFPFWFFISTFLFSQLSRDSEPLIDLLPPFPIFLANKKMRNKIWNSSRVALDLLKWKCQLLSCVWLCHPTDCSCQAPPSMEFSRQEYWSGLPFPSPGDLPNPGMESGSPELWADSLTSEPPGKLKVPVNEKQWYLTTKMKY